MVAPVLANSVSPGSSFNISVSCGNIEGSVYASGSNASVTSSDNWCERGRSVSASAVAGVEGTASVSFYSSDAVDVTSTPAVEVPSGTLIGSGSVSVYVSQNNGGSSGGSSSGGSSNGSTNNGGTNTNNNDNDTKDSENKSTDNTLSSITVNKGTLDPVFDSGTTVYKVVLEADVTAITIDATATDSKASITGTGEKTVKAGDNKIEIIVTAEDGSTKTYTINAYVDEKPDTFMKVKDKDYGVIVNVENVEAPKGFEKTTLSYNGKEIPAWKNTKTNMMLVYLIDEKSDKNFYIYENGEITSIYKPITLLGHDLAIIDVSEDMQTKKGMLFTDIEIDKVKMQGWTFEDEAFVNYIVVYLMNENGEKVYYQYEKTSNTLQPYSGTAAITQQAYEELLTLQIYQWIGIAVLGGVSVFALFMWSLSARKNKCIRKSSGKDKDDNDSNQPFEPVQTLRSEVKPNVEPSPMVSKPQQTQTQGPSYHRSRSSQRIEEPMRDGGVKHSSEADFNTQPFRFHDEFDD